MKNENISSKREWNAKSVAVKEQPSKMNNEAFIKHISKSAKIILLLHVNIYQVLAAIFFPIIHILAKKLCVNLRLCKRGFKILLDYIQVEI
jgi:hypothetical protein